MMEVGSGRSKVGCEPAAGSKAGTGGCPPPHESGREPAEEQGRVARSRAGGHGFHGASTGPGNRRSGQRTRWATSKWPLKAFPICCRWTGVRRGECESRMAREA
jgi:hypothetical protein